MELADLIYKQQLEYVGEIAEIQTRLHIVSVAHVRALDYLFTRYKNLE